MAIGDDDQLYTFLKDNGTNTNKITISDESVWSYGVVDSGHDTYNYSLDKSQQIRQVIEALTEMAGAMKGLAEMFDDPVLAGKAEGLKMAVDRIISELL